jgi:long-chain acyl-CoA synthetase
MMNIPKLIMRGAEFHGDKTAVVFGEKRFTFREVNERANRLANGLLRLGVKRGDRVASLNRNCHQHIEIVFARHKIGAVEVNLNPRLSAEEIAWQINDSQTEVLFVAPELLGKVRPILSQCKNIRHVIGFSEVSGQEIGYEELIGSGSPEAPPELETDLYGEGIGAITYTAGTTGRPKGIVWTRKSVWTVARNLLLDMIPDLSSEDVFLGLQPLYHAVGWFILPCWLRGATHVIVPEFHNEIILDTVEREKVTVIKTVPTVLVRLVVHPDIGKRNLQSVRTIIYGASPMPVEPLRQAIRIFGPVFIQNYGQSEAPMTICLLGKKDHMLEGDAKEKARLASVGRPYTLVEVRVVNEDGKDVAVGEMGEVIVRGDHLMKEYWQLPEETAEAFKEGWLYTRDMAKIDKDGYIYLVDRKSEMIISGGLNIYPNEVEQVLYQHPAILEAAVFGVPDRDWGESVKAVVALKSGRTATEQEIIDFCKNYLASYKKPKTVEFMASLPKSPEGKVLRRILREPHWKGHERRIH